MLRQIQQTQDTMRISVHMERKYNVLVNSENIVTPRSYWPLRLKMYIVKNILTTDMFRPEFIQWQNVTTLVLKLFITIKIGFCYYKGLKM